METTTAIKGIITDKSGKPVENAIVMITAGSHEFHDIASVSNEKGEFFLSDIQIPGKYTLQIRYNDNARIHEAVINSPDSVIRINF